MWSKWSAKAFLFGAECGVDESVRGGLLGWAWDEIGDGTEVGEEEEEAGPSPPFARGATGFGMTVVGGACVGIGERGCCGAGIGVG